MHKHSLIACTLDKSVSAIRVTRILRGRKVRFIVQDRESLAPHVSYSLYEAYLSRKTESHNSVQTALSNLRFLATWAKQSNTDIDELLLRGDMLESYQVNSFGAWLRQRGKIRSRTSEPISNSDVSRALNYACDIFVWFARQYATFEGRSSDRAVKMELYLNTIRGMFNGQKPKVRKQKVADDLSEDEINAIENFLTPDSRKSTCPKISNAQVLRDYLIWRLILEFGLREGEVLALRLEDCPRKDENNIRIVRIEDRGKDYYDPRGKYAPRPKTLSRELGFVFENSVTPTLIREYTTRYRRRKVLKHGRQTFQPILDNPAFLILSHRHEKGAPLSVSAMQDLAAEVRHGSGVSQFHWHIVRHAFFNRMYTSIMELKEDAPEMYRDQLRDLVYWGGWENENSLQLYVNGARKKHAHKTLTAYQQGKYE